MTSGAALLGAPMLFQSFNDRRRGTFTGIVDLQAAIKRYIAEHNERPRPFRWTKPANAILSAVRRVPAPSV